MVVPCDANHLSHYHCGVQNNYVVNNACHTMMIVAGGADSMFDAVKKKFCGCSLFFACSCKQESDGIYVMSIHGIVLPHKLGKLP